MEPVFVKAVFDLDCDWQGLPPAYRIYVEDELFAERTWRWTEEYIEEMLQILALPGRYQVKLEPLQPNLAHFHPSNHKIEYGPARWVDSTTLEIFHEGS